MKRNFFLGTQESRTYLLGFLLFTFAGLLPSLSFADFTEVGMSAGVADADELGVRNGIAWGDYDNDGDLDIYMVKQYMPNRLYRNNGDGTFTDVAGFAGVDDSAYGHGGAAFGDYNNDENLDIYLANYNGGGSRLFHNNGDGTFTDVTTSAGVYDGVPYSSGVALGDYNNDGYLDIYVAKSSASNRLYHNNGDGTFTDVAATAGVNDGAYSRSVTFADYDNDGYLDIYVTNYLNQPNRLYHNNGDGTFTNVATSAGVAGADFSLGVTFGDYDNDGFLDICVANYENQPNRLYHNNGNGTFTDVGAIAGFDEPAYSRGVAFGDYDNDGDLDIYVTNHHSRPNRLYRNNGNGSFTDVAAVVGVDDGGESHGVSFADYDRDGDLDLYVTNWNGPNRLYQNNLNDGNFLFVRPLDAAGRFNRHGAVARVFRAGNSNLIGTMMINGGSGYCSQNPYDAHFGLPATGTYDIQVIFPGGIVVDKNVNLLLGNVSPTNIPQGYVEVWQNGYVGGIGPTSNVPPILSTDLPIEQSINTGEPYTLTVTGTDSDGDTVTLSADGVPSWATFTAATGNPATGTFTGTPTFADIGTYTITFTADDGNGGQDTLTVTLVVRPQQAVRRSIVLTGPYGGYYTSRGGVGSVPGGSTVVYYYGDGTSDSTVAGENGSFVFEIPEGNVGDGFELAVSVNGIESERSSILTALPSVPQESVSIMGPDTCRRGIRYPRRGCFREYQSYRQDYPHAALHYRREHHIFYS